MQKLIFLLIPLMFLTSCTIDWNDEKDTKITELEKKITEIKTQQNTLNFEKQKECLGYKNKIVDVIQETLEKGRNEQKIYGRDDYIHDEKLMDIFYSPIKNSCLYSVYITEEYLKDGIITKGICHDFRFHNFLTKSQRDIVSKTEGKLLDIPGSTSKKCDDSSIQKQYELILKELK